MSNAPEPARAYRPRPIDTAGVDWPPELDELLERLAENVHEVWAAQRLAEGWTYGLRRDDARKHNPCLVPFGDLPESEKEYDRQAALQTLKAILGMGYRIHRSS